MLWPLSVIFFGVLFILFFFFYTSSNFYFSVDDDDDDVDFQVLFHLEKIESVNLNNKFQRIVFKPPVVQCGGKHLDG